MINGYKAAKDALEDRGTEWSGRPFPYGFAKMGSNPGNKVFTIHYLFLLQRRSPQVEFRTISALALREGIERPSFWELIVKN